jgi:hypothetical protein
MIDDDLYDLFHKTSERTEKNSSTRYFLRFKANTHFKGKIKNATFAKVVLWNECESVLCFNMSNVVDDAAHVVTLKRRVGYGRNNKK